MKTKNAFLLAGALLTVILAGGCITHPPGNQDQQASQSQPARTPAHKHHDNSKESPSITHPGG